MTASEHSDRESHGTYDALSMFVPGVAAPQGSKTYLGGRRMVEASPLLAGWRATVATHAAPADRGRR